MPDLLDFAILKPVTAMIGLTILMFVHMYFRRIPAMQAAGRDLEEYKNDPSLMQQLPAPARYAADNYNHLFEMPVIFYAICFVALLSGNGDDTAVTLAWVYVGLLISSNKAQPCV